MKYKILITFVLLAFVLNTKSYCQNCNVKESNYYVVSFDIAKKGEPADLGMLMLEDLNNLEIDKTNKESFVCSIYSNTKYLVPPPLDFESNLAKCYRDSSKQVSNIEAPMFFYGLEKMEKKYYTKEFFLNDGTRIEFNLVKLNAKYWEFVRKNRNINNISNQVIIPDTCYSDDYIYSVKEFIDIKKLNRKEKRMIVSILGL